MSARRVGDDRRAIILAQPLRLLEPRRLPGYEAEPIDQKGEAFVSERRRHLAPQILKLVSSGFRGSFDQIPIGLLPSFKDRLIVGAPATVVIERLAGNPFEVANGELLDLFQPFRTRA
nr:hypothetical protein [Pinisolibacter aquiterrae]